MEQLSKSLEQFKSLKNIYMVNKTPQSKCALG